MKLDPKIKHQVEEALKGPVPSPTDPEFDELLLRLRKENPELADLLESAVIFDDLPSPEAETQRAVSRREGLRLLKHRLLDRYDELTGEWVPSRPKQIAVVFTGLILASTLWFALSTRETKPAQGGLPVPLPTARERTTTPPTPSSPDNQAASTAPSSPPTAASATAASTPSTPSPATGGMTPPPPSPPSGGEVPPPPPANSGSTAPSGTGSPTPPPAPPPLTLYTAPTAPSQGAASTGTGGQGAAPAPLTLAAGAPASAIPLTLGARPTSSPAPTSPRPITGSVADDVTAALQGTSAPTAGAGSGAQSLTLGRETQSTFAVRALEGQGGQGRSFYLVGGPAQAPDAPSSPRGGVAPQAASPAFVPPASPAFVPPSSPPAQTLAAPTLPPSPYTLGTRLKGRLGVGVLIAEGAPGAVAVDAEDGSTWVGEVTLDETRRLKGRLTRVIKDGREYAVNATLLDADGTLGVAARVREEAPSIAADLIRGSLRGVSDYVTAASQAKSVTVLPGGGVAQSSQTPPLELFMAGSLANLFALQQDKKAVVRVAQADKGTEVVILVIPNQEPAAGK